MSKKLAIGARKAGMKGKRSASKRELIDAGETKMDAERAAKGEVQKIDDVARSPAAERRRS